MFSYEEIEDAIYQRLKPIETAEIEVMKLPENQEDFKRPFKKARIWISYKGSTWGDAKDAGFQNREERMLFEIAVQSRSLRGDRGVYPVMNVIIYSLAGFVPPNCSVSMFPKESGLTDTGSFVDGVWTYTILFQSNSESVQDFEEDLSVILRRIIFKNPELGDEVVVETA